MTFPTEIEEEARNQLPYANEWEADVIRILISKKIEINRVAAALLLPSAFCSPLHYDLEFRKCYVDGIVIGWEFVGFKDGL